jgi:hypothetical protein
MQNYLRGHSESGRSLYVGDVLAGMRRGKLALIDVKNRFSVGDRLEIIHPSGNRQWSLERMQNLDGPNQRRSGQRPSGVDSAAGRIAGRDAGALRLSRPAPMSRPHLFVDISAHGFGHLAQVAPVLNALGRRLPNCA